MWFSSQALLVTEVLRENEASGLYRAEFVGDGRAVLVKALGPAKRTPEDVARLRRELELGARIDLDVVPRATSCDSDGDIPILVYEACPGEPLDRIATPGLERFLRIAIAIASAIEALHGRGVVHKNLKPENILVDSERGKAKLIGLELASLLPSEQQSAVNPWLVEGSLPYMSPEQTGRTNYAIDSRSDLYSLGITLFELRAGRLPFQAQDPLGWMHAHLARTAPSLDEVAPRTPPTVAAIVKRLLAKSPDDRYQSASGLRHDLERCLYSLGPDGTIDRFAIGARDVHDRFQIPQKLYGREPQIRVMQEAFARVVATGTPSLLLVAGYPGIGKTALVRELERPLVAEGGLFQTGKCDELRRGTPHSSLTQAMRSLVTDRIGEPEHRRELFRKQLASALGAHARLMLNVVPELEEFLGPLPAVGPLRSDESDRRFRATFRAFVGAFARRAHPVVLFLDDLQWIDRASLVLLEDVLTSPEVRHFLLIGTFRADEVDITHPLHKWSENLRGAGTRVEQIALGPLGLADVTRLVADALHTGAREALPLARLVHEQTAGNPFFVIQLLSRLYSDELIFFERESGTWSFDLGAIQACGITDNVVDLMVAKMKRLPDSTREALEVASAIGNSFDVASLAAMKSRSEDAIHRDLWEALRVGLVLRNDGTYRFVHDRVQEAAYSLVPEAKRADVHAAIGRLLLAEAGEGDAGERIFDIVGQLNRGVGRIVDPRERARIADLNLRAGRRARLAAAYASAVDFLGVGISLLDVDAWENAHELTLGLHVERAHAAYLNRDFELAESLLDLVLSKTTSRLEKAAAYGILVQLHVSKGMAPRACSLGLEFFRLFGVDLPLHPSPELEAQEFRDVLERLGDRTVDELVDLRAIEDDEVAALLNVLTVTSSASLFVDTTLWALIASHRVRLSLEHGVTDATAHAFATLALALEAHFGNYDDARRFGQVALGLVERRGLVGHSASVYLNVGVFVSYWLEPLEVVGPNIERAMQAGFASGSITYVCYAAQMKGVVSLARGDRLDDVAADVGRMLELVCRHRFRDVADAIEVNRWLIERLQGRELRIPALPRAFRIESSDLETYLRAPERWRITNFVFWARKLEVAVIFGEWPDAAAAARTSESLAHFVPAFPQAADFVFYAAIAHAKAGAREPLSRFVAQLRTWTKYCPSTFRARTELAEAELARLDGREFESARHYEAAIENAREQGQISIEALAYELAGEFFESRGFRLIGRTYVRESYVCYERWGATAKLKAMEQKYGDFVQASDTTSSSTFALGAAELDVLSIVKASQAVAAEIHLDELSRELVRSVVEQGGAQRGCLILDREGHLTVEAIAEVDDGGVRVELLTDTALEGSEVVPESVVNQVVLKRERIVLDDASSSEFANDPYVIAHNSRSILVFPIARRGRAVGYVYLENAAAAGVFAQERIAVLELISSQASISLENAKLFEATQDLNATLRQEIRDRREAEAAARASESRLVGFLEGLPVGVYICTADGNPYFANRAAKKIFQTELLPSFRREELTNITGFYLAGTDERYPLDRAPVLRAMMGETCMVDDLEIEAGDRRVPLAVWGTPIRADDRSVRYAIVAFQDISAERRAQRERVQLETELREAQRLESIGRLAAGVAHDFNNLLVPIMGYADMMMRASRGDDRVKTWAAEILGAADQAASVARQLLAFARRERLEVVAVDLNDVVGAFARMMRRVIREDIEVSVVLDPDLGRVLADRSQMDRVLMNLAVNASDAMPGGGKLTIETLNVTVDDERARAHRGLTVGEYVVLRVIDTGHGMDAKTLERIFEPFFTTKGVGKGTGLGLATVYGLVTQQGGHVICRSEIDRGTEMEIYLPRLDGPMTDVTSAVMSADTHPEAVGARETILVVEDEERVRRVLETALGARGYDVVATSSPEEAVREARRLGERIGLIVSDVVMPEMSGPELFARLSTDQPSLKVLFISGYAEDAIAAHGVLEPGVEFLFKPFTTAELTNKVREILDR